jgi:hypothetical protein
VKGDASEHKHGAGLPMPVIEKIKPIYQRLSQDDLLEKCLHGKTQNQNESLTAMIWQRVPKEIFVGPAANLGCMMPFPISTLELQQP